MEALILIGFKGVGKSTIGRQIALERGWSFFDSDEMIAPEEGIRTFYRQYGREGLRQRERELLANWSEELPFVLATGGGTPLDPVCAKSLQELGGIYHVQLPFAKIRERIQLPAFVNDWNELEALYHERLPLYEKLATEDSLEVISG